MLDSKSFHLKIFLGEFSLVDNGLMSNRPFAVSDHMVHKTPCWRAR